MSSWDRGSQSEPRATIRILRAVGGDLKDLCAEGWGVAEKSSKATALIQPRSLQGRVERQEDAAEGETKVALEKELRAQRSDKEQSIA